MVGIEDSAVEGHLVRNADYRAVCGAAEAVYQGNDRWSCEGLTGKLVLTGRE